MENILRFLPLLLGLMSRGGDIARIIGLVTQALGLVQELLPPPAAGQPDVATMRGIQEALKKLGYDPGSIDGQIGDKTKAAVKLFQAQHPPLEADGWPGFKTQAAIAFALGNQ